MKEMTGKNMSRFGQILSRIARTEPAFTRSDRTPTAAQSNAEVIKERIPQAFYTNSDFRQAYIKALDEFASANAASKEALLPILKVVNETDWELITAYNRTTPIVSVEEREKKG